MVIKKSQIEKTSIFHGPATVGGAGWYLAELQRSIGYKSDCFVYDDKGFKRLYHRNLYLYNEKRLKRLFLKFRLLIEVLKKYKIIHFYMGQTILPFGLDLPILKLFGKKLIMCYVGSESRILSIEKINNPYSYLIRDGIDHPKFDNQKKRMIKWQNIWIDKFLTPREMSEYVQFLIPKRKTITYPWLNNVATLFISKTAKPIFVTENKIPIIVHAPSNRGIKGTVHIEKALEKMRKKGINFEFKLLEKLDNIQVQKIIRKSDIIIDTLIHGGFGNFSLEGLAYGKPVVAYLPEVRNNLHSPDCPIYSTTIDNFETRLEELITNKKLRIKLGKLGVKFVQKHFNENLFISSLDKIYKEIL